jgi:hypothetical protein
MGGRKRVRQGWELEEEEEKALGEFVRTSVTKGTMKKNSYGWVKWCEYMDGLRFTDYYMKTANWGQKVRHMMSFFLKRYGEGLRGKQATKVEAAIRKYFAIKLEETDWMDDPRIRVCRRLCRRSPEENRTHVRESKGRDKKPTWLDLLVQIREEL